MWCTAAKKAGKRYRGILEAAELFMVKWHEDDAKLSRQRRAFVVAGAPGNGGRGGNKRDRRKPDQVKGGRGGGQQEE